MRTALLITLVAALAMLAGCGSSAAAKKGPAEPVVPADSRYQYVDTDTGRWLIHDMNRPAPPIITPDEPGGQFKDVIVLFGGDNPDLSNWEGKWIVKDDYMESVKGSGPIKTKQHFGSCQLHVEFRTPTPPKGSSQGRGNSGVFFQGEYEVQVLDSFENITYADGQCGALYGRVVPLVNACLRPGEWQTYDIVFIRPIFKDGKVVRKACFTVFHNGMLIHHAEELEGGTDWRGPHKISDYRIGHPDKGPIMLQDHGNPVRFRNIWVRELKD